MAKQKDSEQELSRRERQIMDIVYARQEASAADVREAMEDAPGYSTVRKLLTILVEKGHLKYREEAGRYLYRPTRAKGVAGQSAMARVLNTFFEGSLEKAVAAMLGGREAKPSAEELQRLSQLIEDARKEGR